MSTNSPTRTEQHEIDTMAVRFVRDSIPSYWIDRELSERDYGIDLALEFFSKDQDAQTGQRKSTGLLSLQQIKGTTQELSINKGYLAFPNFPVKTLVYAMQFKIPFFFIVVCMNKEKKQAYYLWLQDFIKNKGNGLLNRNWRSQETTALYIPTSNDFINSQDNFVQLIKKDFYETKILEIVRKYYLIKDYTIALPNVILPSVMKLWLDLLRSIRNLSYFDLEDVVDDDDLFVQFDWKKTKDECEIIMANNSITVNQITFLQEQLGKIEDIISYSLFTEKSYYK